MPEAPRSNSSVFSTWLGRGIARGRAFASRSSRLSWVVVILSSLLIAPGCGPSTGPRAKEGDAKQQASEGGREKSSAQGESAATKPPLPELSAEDLLAKVRTAYRQAAAYRDHGSVVVGFAIDGERAMHESPLEVQFERPNKIRVAANRARVACDGQHLRARILDEQTRNLDEQMIGRTAPQTLSRTDVAGDPVLADAGYGSGPVAFPLPIELLLDDNALSGFLEPNVQRTMLPPDQINGRWCYRLSAATADGPFVFWVDGSDLLVRRVQYPTAALQKEKEAEFAGQAKVSDVSLTAEFREAAFAPPSEKDFSYALVPSKDAKVVQYFVIPPQPLAHPKLGQAVGDFSFAPLGGGELSRKSLTGKVSVLLWFGGAPESGDSVRLVGDAIRNLGAGEKLAAAGVCTDGANIREEDLQTLARDWKSTLPLARDEKEYGRTVFGIQRAPSVVVLDGKGVMQWFALVDQPELRKQLESVVTAVLSGEDVAGGLVAQANTAQQQYQSQLQIAEKTQQTAVVPLAQVEIAPASEPAKLQLAPLWTCDELKAPGNLLVADGNGGPRIFALEGFRTVTELDAQGKIVARRTLDLPQQAAVTYLRTALDGKKQRYFAACSPLGKQAFVFDDQWQKVLAWPPSDEQHDGIRDVQLADLAGDGRLSLYVGYFNLLGVQAVDLSGKRAWSTRVTLPSALALAVSPANEVGYRKLLAVNDRGEVVRINQFGNTDRPLAVKDRPLHYLAAASAPSKGAAYCGLTLSAKGDLTPVGLTENLTEAWSYPFLKGTHDGQLEPVAQGPRIDKPGWSWLVAGPDGSLHVISDDGEFVDRFFTGARITGLALARLGDSPVLLLASEKKITAWRVAVKK